MSRASLLALLGAIVAGGFAAWWVLRGSSHPAAHAPANVEDDLDLVVSLLDGAASEPPRDVLVAGTDERYLARASDRTIVAVGGADGGADARAAERTLAVLDAPARGMALAGGALWVTTGRAIDRVPLAGGAPAVVASGLAKPGTIAADATWLFVVDVEAARGLTHASSVVRVPAGGGERLVLGRSDGEITNVVLDDAAVYWADCLEGTIVAAPKAGGPSRVLASDRGLPGELAADANALYWVEKRSESLWTMPKTGGAPRQLAQDFAGFANLLVDAHGVFWTNEAAVEGAFSVLTVPRTGGEVSAASDPAESIGAFASDGAHLYWERAGAVAPVERP